MNAVLQAPPLGRILRDVPAAEYHKRELGVASQSVLKLIREKSPAHYRAWVDAEDDADTPALAFGRAYHAAVLEPDKFASEYIVLPDFGDMRSSKNRAMREAFKDEHPTATFIDAEDGDKIVAMREALLRHPVVRGILKDGFPEVTMRWIDPQTGVECKARGDWYRPGKFFADLKTTLDASPEAFRRSVVSYGYHVQHAHYCDGANACGEPVENYLIVAQEKDPPYVAAVYHIDSFAEARGFELRERGLQTMRECIDSDTWPGYGAGITELTLPQWALEDRT